MIIDFGFRILLVFFFVWYEKYKMGLFFCLFVSFFSYWFRIVDKIDWYDDKIMIFCFSLNYDKIDKVYLCM